MGGRGQGEARGDGTPRSRPQPGPRSARALPEVRLEREPSWLSPQGQGTDCETAWLCDCSALSCAAELCGGPGPPAPSVSCGCPVRSRGDLRAGPKGVGVCAWVLSAVLRCLPCCDAARRCRAWRTGASDDRSLPAGRCWEAGGAGDFSETHGRQ